MAFIPPGEFNKAISDMQEMLGGEVSDIAAGVHSGDIIETPDRFGRYIYIPKAPKTAHDNAIILAMLWMSACRDPVTVVAMTIRSLFESLKLTGTFYHPETKSVYQQLYSQDEKLSIFQSVQVSEFKGLSPDVKMGPQGPRNILLDTVSDEKQDFPEMPFLAVVERGGVGGTPEIAIVMEKHGPTAVRVKFVNDNTVTLVENWLVKAGYPGQKPAKPAQQS